MPYDKKFYRMYRDYLNEKMVRRNHDLIFDYFRRFSLPGTIYVMDLGCGLGEYHLHGGYTDYAGIDLNDVGKVRNFIQADYHSLACVNRLPFRPTAFVSLFSIEPFHTVEAKYAFYERIFSEVPSVEYGLASGFFYEKRRGRKTVKEKGKVVSYQTIEDPSRFISDKFSEFRLHIKTPSKMFGKDVVDVWKIFIRR